MNSFSPLRWSVSFLSLAASFTPALAQCPYTWDVLPGANAFLGYALAYDTHRERAVMFGGRNRQPVTVLDETWEFDGHAWSRLEISGPPARAGAAMIYDAYRRQVILFGGSDWASPPYDDTWAFDGQSWRKLAVAGPSARTMAGFAYDSQRHEGILFGGLRGQEALGDCWKWTGERWESITSPGPTPRAHHSMVFDERRGVVVLFGGVVGATYLGDTWEWDGSNWTQRLVTGPGPRRGAAMVYASAYGRTLLIAGMDPGALPPYYFDYADIWSWDGLGWDKIAGYPAPDYLGPSSTVACYEPRLGTVLLGPGQRQGFIQEWTERHIVMLPPGLLQQPDPVLLCDGGDARFSVRAIGIEPMQFRWTLDGMPLADGQRPSGALIEGSSTPSLAIYGARHGDEGGYACTVSNACGETVTQPAALRICAADLACDGGVDFIDFLEYLSLYERSDPRADLNGDGIVDLTDYLEFLNHYDAGC